MNVVIKYNSSKKIETKYISLDEKSKFIFYEPIYFQPPKCEISNNTLKCINPEKELLFQNKFLEIEQSLLNEFEKHHDPRFFKLFSSKLNEHLLYLNGNIDTYLECLCILKIDGIHLDMEKNIFQLNITVHSVIETGKTRQPLQELFYTEIESNESEEPEIEEEFPMTPIEIPKLDLKDLIKGDTM